MNISLDPSIQKQIDDRVRSGQYRSAEDVIAAAVSTLAQQEALVDFAPGELNALLEEAEQAIDRGEVMDGDAVFEELRRRHEHRRGKRE